MKQIPFGDDRKNDNGKKQAKAPPFVRSTWIGFRWWVCLAIVCSGSLWASGPRWVTGPPFFKGDAGVPVVWAQSSLLYSTDPGDLSTYVNHAAADVLVAGAASVWNVSVASVTLGQGAPLSEHVSGANVYLGANGLVYPADVASTSYAAVPIAVIYDSDGSVTDTLLGAGASAPASCRENAVTESVDLFDPAGYILHALIILNGRCTGPAVAQQTAMKYQLVRAFGRVLGLAWSQANDNVFTGVPTPTYNQALNWPLMHPIDIVCGPYTYQCLPLPFQLRPDDLASLVLLYGIGASGAVPAGKQASLATATWQDGTISFPDGEGMAGVNVLATRMPAPGNAPEGWVEASAVTGAFFRRMGSTPLAAARTDALSSLGTLDQTRQGYFNIAYIPMPVGALYDDHVLTTEPVNPLYIGGYSLGPYGPGAVMPSGSALAETVRYLQAGDNSSWNATAQDAAVACGSGNDGTEALPAEVDPTGWWTGLLCGWGHVSWAGLAVRPGRTLTLDVTALDANGYATTGKAMPVLGAWGQGDPPGTLATMGATAAAFNALAPGTSRLTLDTSQQTGLRMAIADERGEGRPDFNYRARILYADTVIPAVVPVGGGTVTVAGMGFRAGNAVTVNGVSAQVLSWSANSLVVQVPASVATAPVDVAVADLSTGASSVMSGALTYFGGALPKMMRLVSAPVGDVYAGDAAGTALAVQVLAGDGVTPVAGETVVFSVSAGVASFNACAAASCAVLTDAQGMASTPVTPLAAGSLTLQAADGGLSETASLTVLAAVGSVVVLSAPAGPLTVGMTAPVSFNVRVLAPGGAEVSGTPVTYTSIPPGAVRFGACEATLCTVTSAVDGYAGSFVAPLVAGPVMLVATADHAAASVSLTAVAAVETMQVLKAPGGTNFVGQETASPYEVAVLGGDGVTPIFGRNVTFTAPAGVVLDACGASTCTLAMDWEGVTTGVVPMLPGTFTVQATDGVVTQTATFTAIARTQHMNVVSVPANGSAVGLQAATPFAVQLFDLDGVTPLAGWAVTLVGAQLGTAAMLGCTVTSSCQLTTNGQGIVSTAVMPLVVGPVSLQAVAGPLTQMATFTSAAGATSVTATQPMLYVAEGSTVAWTLGATAVLAGAAASGEVLSWTGSTGFQLAAAQTVADATGASSLQAMVGPLMGGAVAGATACAWDAVCAGFSAIGVSSTALRLAEVSASASGVVVRVVDESGDPVAGATVSASQTVTAGPWCTGLGRCPAVPIVASGSTSAVSDGQGLVHVVPLGWSGGAAVVHLAFSVGTAGFLALELGL